MDAAEEAAKKVDELLKPGSFMAQILYMSPQMRQGMWEFGRRTALARNERVEGEPQNVPIGYHKNDSDLDRAPNTMMYMTLGSFEQKLEAIRDSANKIATDVAKDMACANPVANFEMNYKAAYDEASARMNAYLRQPHEVPTTNNLFTLIALGMLGLMVFAVYKLVSRF
jgi:hypothetical protein